jgi:uncharacterized membrane protein AbrB (regulator of aidB expression)
VEGTGRADLALHRHTTFSSASLTNAASADARLSCPAPWEVPMSFMLGFILLAAVIGVLNARLPWPPRSAGEMRS